MCDIHLENPGVGDSVMMCDIHLENPGGGDCVMCDIHFGKSWLCDCDCVMCDIRTDGRTDGRTHGEFCDYLVFRYRGTQLWDPRTF